MDKNNLFVFNESRLYKIKNKNPKGPANEYYYMMVTIGEDGGHQFHFFTESDILTAQDRAEKNKEDIPLNYKVDRVITETYMSVLKKKHAHEVDNLTYALLDVRERYKKADYTIDSLIQNKIKYRNLKRVDNFISFIVGGICTLILIGICYYYS